MKHRYQIIRRMLTVACCAVALVLSMGAANAQAAKTMKLAFGLAKDSHFDIFAKTFAEEVQKLSDGSIKVRRFCCLKMGGEQEMFKKLQLGTLDATLIAQNNAGPFYPKLDILTLPYIFKSPEHAEAVVDGPIGQAIWADMPKEARVHLVKIAAISFRHLYNTEKAIENIDDFKPLKYRVPKNSVMVDTYKAFGSDPVPLAWSETLTAVQTGTVDGGDLTIDVIYSQKFHEVAKHIAMTGHFVYTPPFFVSDRFMKKLTPEEKKAVYAAADVAAEETRKLILEDEAKLIESLKSKHGVSFTSPAREPFVQAAYKVQADFAKARGAEYERLIEAIKEQAEVVSAANAEKAKAAKMTAVKGDPLAVAAESGAQ